MVKNGYSEQENNFKINRHSLQILQPIDEHGQLQCDSPSGRMFPRLDYSKGFPDWWFLSHTEVTVPSEHTQGGKHYDAEVHLAHFYSENHDRKVGKVVLFLEADPSRERWSFLDKLICQWREVEEQTRDECDLESVPPYPGCRNPTREKGETNLPPVDPYPFIDCDSVENSERICKSTSCCESERSTGGYCRNNVYDFYGDETVGSICWWCCPGKLLAPADGEPNPAPVEEPASTPSSFPTGVPSTYGTGDLDDTSEPTQDLRSPSPTTPDSLIGPSSSPSGPASSMTPATTAPVMTSPVDCSDYNGHLDINLYRICKDGGCCDPVRSSTDHCHVAYTFFGNSMVSVCSECCSPSKELAPAPPPHSMYPQIDCAAVENPFRICKPTSCCNEVRSTSAYCVDIYETYGDMMGSVCWYCCSEPKEVDPSVLPPTATQPSKVLSNAGSSRRLRSRQEDPIEEPAVLEARLNGLVEATDAFLPTGIWASDLAMDPANFEVAENLEEEYVAGIDAYRKRQEETKGPQQSRRLESGDNYVNVPYSPYEWMREVRTEYYYRYEGTQMVPPCFERVHYRVMKDPIRIHPDQLTELERLLAWRISPKGSEFNECERDTAGRERPGSSGNAVDLNRPLQSRHNVHYKVFCECGDWDSKWQEDRDWCELDAVTRLTDHPYNFETVGF